MLLNYRIIAMYHSSRARLNCSRVIAEQEQNHVFALRCSLSETLAARSDRFSARGKTPLQDEGSGMLIQVTLI